MRIKSKTVASEFFKTIRLYANDGLELIGGADSIDELPKDDQKKLIKILEGCRGKIKALDNWQK